ncbi:Hypothetical predicted protein [Octopus vulgaris]|uniref:Uncharacterized protein n=1 Tax=Octopus vulgaris TaxID=6645 RepID=A0AA36BK44_OCTVU|nr:Hypothetical predicted protein [Octopus vulgaris]
MAKNGGNFAKIENKRSNTMLSKRNTRRREFRHMQRFLEKAARTCSAMISFSTQKQIRHRQRVSGQLQGPQLTAEQPTILPVPPPPPPSLAPTKQEQQCHYNYDDDAVVVVVVTAANIQTARRQI